MVNSLSSVCLSLLIPVLWFAALALKHCVHHCKKTKPKKTKKQTIRCKRKRINKKILFRNLVFEFPSPPLFVLFVLFFGDYKDLWYWLWILKHSFPPLTKHLRGEVKLISLTLWFSLFLYIFKLFFSGFNCVYLRMKGRSFSDHNFPWYIYR